ncbi:hypothetical protein DFP72DRAFT_1172703 [Ephemerocybe angulata]|uniref:F-box domain-containing protein n=1 Tax=Ephemerocybe angulata TaxID=980116 RepID=A0A8H6HPH6_9AGAR|nr:hypothetical protein DFP72DRAFT_1172703 [Tulosesus angulatus]
MDPNILDILPEEILDLIVEAISHTWRQEAHTCSELRLVCKTFSSLFERVLFTKTTINASESFTPDQLRSFASKGPNARWTRKLNIQFIDRAEKTEGEGRSLLELAITGLRNLESVRLSVQPHRPNEDVIRALSQLPGLRQAELDFDDSCDSDLTFRGLPRFHHLANLRSLELKNIPPCWVTEIRRTIANSPRLETLDLLFAEFLQGFRGGIEFHPTSDWPEPALDIAWMVKDVLSAPAFTPTLNSLSILGCTPTLSTSAIPYLSALTELVIDPEGTSVIDPSFWVGLSQAGVKLKSLDLSPITAPIVAYLTSYVGLEELDVFCDVDVPDTNPSDMAHEVYHKVVVHHKDTLRVFRADGVSSEVWAFRTEFFESILQCKKLQELKIPFLHGPDTTDISCPTASNLVTAISRELQCFQELSLDFEATEGDLFGFILAVCDIKPSISALQFSIEIVTSQSDIWSLAFDRDVGHFVVISVT